MAKDSLDPAQSLQPHTVTINRERCKGCGYCAAFCPRKVLAMSTEINSKGYTPAVVKDQEKCAGCGLCEMICPEFGITVTHRTSEN